MEISVTATKIAQNMMTVLSLTIIVLLTVSTNMVLAKRGGIDDNRSEFYGIIQERPKNVLQREWVIGGRRFITETGTEFDQSEGSLKVGSCAKVHMRDDRVHEIDSEPMRNCQ